MSCTTRRVASGRGVGRALQKAAAAFVAASWAAAALAAPPATGAAAAGAGPAAPSLKSAYPALGERGRMYYARRYGVDELKVRSISSGSSLEFRYRVTDPRKAHPLGDQRSKPYLFDLKSGKRLPVSTLERLGELRQTATLEQGREYWMIFANPGRLVKPGERVDVVAGTIRVSGLTVE